MSRALFILILAVLVAPRCALAEMYKCKHPDGKTSFQDNPCEKGSEGTPVYIDDPSPAYDPSAKSRAPTLNKKAGKAPESRTPIADEGVRQRNRQLEAENRAMRCSGARRNLEVLKRERPVFSYDKQGKRVYVEDSNRQSEVAAAQQQVAEACN